MTFLVRPALKEVARAAYIKILWLLRLHFIVNQVVQFSTKFFVGEMLASGNTVTVFLGMQAECCGQRR
jgi:hypothetical protein